MTNHQLLAIVIVAIWLSAAIGACGTKRAEIFQAPAIVTILIGIGYLVLKSRGH